jgi:hypothetical protein
MKLIVLYGLPGVGKLTTAKALSALTGFRLFHNHLSFDLVKAIFDFPSPPFGRLLATVRLAAFEEAAREGVPGLIFTFVYAAPHDDAFLEAMLRVVRQHDGQVLFVRLTCDPAVNDARITAPERRAYGKVTSVEWLRKAQAHWRMEEAIPFGESFEIDNTALEPDTSARRIAAHFSLPGA